nr:hypothetical protein [Tanacetum cinerariifolium]
MKRAGFDLQQESSKKQRLDQQTEEIEEEDEAQGDNDQEVEELKLYIRIILKEDIEIKAIPLAIKPSVIIEYKIVKEGKISTYHITRADRSTRRYTSMINLLKNIDREDLKTLWKLVKDKYGNTRPEEGHERVLWGDLKVMFEPDIESECGGNYKDMIPEGCSVTITLANFSRSDFTKPWAEKRNLCLTMILSSLKIDSLLDEFTGELTLLKSIPSGIDETDCYHENDIRLIERLLYDNSSPRPPKEFVSENSDADIESFSPSPIPDEDSDSRMEEIDLTCTPYDPMPPSIEDDDDDDDSKRDILIHEELFDNYSLSLPEIESFYFDIPSFSRPPAKPPDGNT